MDRIGRQAYSLAKQEATDQGISRLLTMRICNIPSTDRPNLRLEAKIDRLAGQVFQDAHEEETVAPRA
jgi:hypothetical protein